MTGRQFSQCISVLGVSTALVACGGRGSMRGSSAPPALDAVRGSYVFLANGTDLRGRDYFVAGSITADGRGNLAGVEDLKVGSRVDSAIPFEGTYQLDSGGTVNATVSDGTETVATLTFVVPNGPAKAM